MKLKVLTIKKNPAIALIACILILLVFSFAYFQIVQVSISRYNGITIVLDAGHGGRDGGSVGANGTIEKEINLKYTLALKQKLVKAGYRVHLTRENDDGLYSNTAKNKKTSDMKARLNIIKRANPNLVLSIHMNSFRDHSVRGASTYYRAGDEASKACADTIQKCLNTYCNAPSNKSSVGDYYILNSSYYTAVLIECGFISNPEEETLLNSNEYLDRFTDSIVSALMLYFGNQYMNSQV